MTPIAAVRSLPRFAYLSPAEAREVVLAVLGAVRVLDGKALDAAAQRIKWIEECEGALGMAPTLASYSFSAAIDALVAEVQEEGRPLPPASDSVDS